MLPCALCLRKWGFEQILVKRWVYFCFWEWRIQKVKEESGWWQEKVTLAINRGLLLVWLEFSSAGGKSLKLGYIAPQGLGRISFESYIKLHSYPSHLIPTVPLTQRSHIIQAPHTHPGWSSLPNRKSHHLMRNVRYVNTIPGKWKAQILGYYRESCCKQSTCGRVAELNVEASAIVTIS